ncbi:MAG: undecaprenyldiphospho-muramoylpentapeptide beta-N-acetylglucosaminyltransferase [Christensenellaceae bacterium]|jgi:UDP-N-acetylglucosamine--N-acetylmuramyl-(pentapeptide) pyrophosphoryl-undecaprenol N-acetylglucosamine transferase
MKKRIVLTGGGSAGHVTPNLALLEDLEKNDIIDVHYIGTQNGIEKEIVAETGIPYHAIRAGKLRRYFSVKNFTDLFRLINGYFGAKKILKSLRPSLVFSKGGFVSVPVVYAAAKLSIPVILHESDYTPGLANRLCAKKASVVCLSFDKKQEGFERAVVTGSPVRRTLLSGNREKGMQFLQFSGGLPVLLIMGGSLGARAINTAVDECIDQLTHKYFIVHLRGKNNLNHALDGRENYRQFEYLSEELKDIYAVADFALSRAGANAVFEFLALRLPALLIPLPLSASRGDQLLNAGYFDTHGFARMLPQEELSAQSLLKALDDLYNNRKSLIKNMEESHEADGTQNVLDVIYESIGNDNG